MESGKFIVIEGLEGAGKSTAIRIIKSAIESAGHKVLTTREPGGTPMAEAIRDCVKNDWESEEITIEAELLLMYASRVQLLENVIKPALQRGEWVVGDRHDMSSRAYQGGGRQIPANMIEPLRTITLKGFTPDLTLYMDVTPEEGLKRARGRGELDRIEQAGLEFFERTRKAYLGYVKSEDNVVMINTMQNLEKVHAEIKQTIVNYMSQACIPG